MLWSCPILEDIDLDSLEKCVLNHDFPYLAALLLPFRRHTKRSDLLKVHQLARIHLGFNLNFLLIVEVRKHWNASDCGEKVNRKV